MYFLFTYFNPYLDVFIRKKLRQQSLASFWELEVCVCSHMATTMLLVKFAAVAIVSQWFNFPVCSQSVHNRMFFKYMGYLHVIRLGQLQLTSVFYVCNCQFSINVPASCVCVVRHIISVLWITNKKVTVFSYYRFFIPSQKNTFKTQVFKMRFKCVFCPI